MEQDKFFGVNGTIAIVGVSDNPEKWGRKIFDSLKAKKRDVFAINPKHKSINGNKCYPNIDSLPKKPKLVITVTPPKVTLNILKQCKEQMIEKIWVQPGSDSIETREFAKSSSLNVVFDSCFLIEQVGEKND